MKIEEQFEKKFHKFREIKRRDPKFYMKNPNKIRCATLGNRDYAYKDMAKGNEIEIYDNQN